MVRANTPPWYAEAVLCGDRSVLQPPCNTPFSLDQHPLRVLVYGDGDRLLLVGTCRKGEPTDPLSYVRDLLDHAGEQYHAVGVDVLDRITHEVFGAVLAAETEAEHES